MQGLLFYFLNIILQGIGVFVKQIFASNGLYLSKKHSANVRWYCFFSPARLNLIFMYVF